MLPNPHYIRTKQSKEARDSQTKHQPAIMSYADVASRGPSQPDSEKVPNTIPEIEHSDSGVHSLDSMSSSSAANMSYADQQLASERAAEAEEEAQRAADKTSKQAQDFTAQADSELKRLEKETGKKYEEFSKEAKESYDKWNVQARKDWDKVKKEAKEDERWAEKNKGNPVVVGNAVVISAFAGLLGIGAFRMHQQGTLTWKVASAWAGVVGLFGLGDYYISQ